MPSLPIILCTETKIVNLWNEKGAGQTENNLQLRHFLAQSGTSKFHIHICRMLFFSKSLFYVKILSDTVIS